MFKQFLQARAIDFCQIDACRLGGVNEVLAVLLLAAKFGVPVCPHAGGVGLCEYVQHLSIFDYVAVSGSLDNRVLEYVDHLHEHFVDPVVIRNGRYMPPENPGYSAALKPASLTDYIFPSGARLAKPGRTEPPDQITITRRHRAPPGTPAKQAGRRNAMPQARWTMIFLCCLANTINYIDRANLAVAAPTMQRSSPSMPP